MVGRERARIKRDFNKEIGYMQGTIIYCLLKEGKITIKVNNQQEDLQRLNANYLHEKIKR